MKYTARKYRARSWTLLGSTIMSLLCAACSDTEDLVELGIDPPSRQQIDTRMVGVNNFFVDSRFGSITDQFSEIRGTLGIRFVRVLFAWTDSVQPSPDAIPQFGLFDEILSVIPPDTDVMITVAHAPSWMANSANWIENNPRLTWTVRWLNPLLQRYAGHPRVVGWQIWNEPNLTVVPADAALGLENPALYLELLRLGSAEVRVLDPSKLVIMAATTSIQQNYPDTIRFNEQLRDLGAEQFIDVWAVHYYGKQFENVVRSNGVRDFLTGLSKRIWVTESGEQGPNEQLGYVETVWPFLKDEIPNIERFYYFQYAGSTPVAQSFGLRNPDPQFPVSDLYIYLKDHAGR